jgi:predicted outer membrane repeat protein
MLGLTLVGGNGVGASNNGYGGAVLFSGSLSMTRCALVGNSAINGGAIYTGFGATGLTLAQCSLSENSAGAGGAIYASENQMTLTQCTLNGNLAQLGGAIYFPGSASATLTHCTLSGNSANPSGGAIYITGIATLTDSTFSRDSATASSGTLTLTNSIVAGNTSPSGPDISNGATIIPTGVNLIGNLIGSGLSAGPSVLVGAPLLAPLGKYGGPTQTMALRPGSPARNAAVGSTITTDQRGFPVVGIPDIGAYEAGTFNSFLTWSWETAGSALSFNSDNESDGAINGLEYATRRDPLAGDILLSPTIAPNGLGGRFFQFRYQKDARDLRYIVQRSPNLALPGGGWSEIYRYDSSTGLITENGLATGDENPATQFITITDGTVQPQLFWRLIIEQVP